MNSYSWHSPAVTRNRGARDATKPRPQGNANAQNAQRAPESREQIMSTLKQLGELKAAGILTDAEFETKKKELLAKL